MGLKQTSLKDASPVPAAEFSGTPLSDRAVTMALGFILCVVFLAYLNTLWFSFVHDDIFQIVGNAWLRSWKFLPRYFTSEVWAFRRPIFPSAYYRPLFLLWFRLQYLAFGLNPWGWHLCTVLCHLGVTLLAYYTAAELLKDRLAALFAAMIFGLHPTHAEAVAWVSGVTEPLFAIFVLASYLCYLKKRALPGQARTYLSASLILYGLGCLAKETAVVLPLIIFACEFLWGRRTAPSQWRTWFWRCLDALKVTTPYVVVFAIYMTARVLSLGHGHGPRAEQSLLSVLLTWPSVLWFYIQHLVWPTHLIPFYPGDYYSSLDFHGVLLPAFAVLIVGAVLWFWARRSTEAAVGAIWMVVPLLPVLKLSAFSEGHLVHDRYLYLPSFGFAMLVALGLRHLRIGSGRIWGQPAIQLVLAGAIGLAMGVEVIAATACYTNLSSFAPYDTGAGIHSPKSEEDLGLSLWRQGHRDEAIKIYQDFWQTHQDDWEVNYSLGSAYYLTGKLAEADRYLTHAVQVDPTQSDSFFYLGLTKMQMGDLNAAAVNVKQAIALRPDADHYHRGLGIILQMQGNFPAALSEFRKEVDLDPDDAISLQQVRNIEAVLAAGRKGTPPPSPPTSGSSTAH